MINHRNHHLCSLLVLVLTTNTLMPCTGIFLTTQNNAHIYGRTLEFGQDLASTLLFIPRNYGFVATAPSGKQEGLPWKSKYAVVGANAFGIVGLVDGVNEKGLAGGLFYFPDFAQYQEVTKKEYAKSLPIWELLTWILTTCTSVEQVKKIIGTVHVSNTLFQPLHEVVPAHLIIHDSSGASLVIEYTHGTLHLHDNPLGIITNAPTFDWHMTNLRNYINLAPLNASNKKMSGVSFAPLGEGSGMLGLPGDFTPPSRFVRAAFFTQATAKEANELAGVYQAFHILNNFDIPRNVVVNKNGTSDYTLWTSVIDMKNKIFYFRPHANFQLAKIDLMKMDLQSKKTKTFAMKYQDTVVEII